MTNMELSMLWGLLHLAGEISRVFKFWLNALFYDIENILIWEKIMIIKKCSNCSFRAKYDDKPKSLLGRIWRWYTKYCPS
jgi:hypothetical protein